MDLRRTTYACGACDTSCASGDICLDGGCVPPSALRIVDAPVRDFVVNGGFVYFLNASDGTVNRVPAGGGAITPLATFEEGLDSLDIDATNLVWTSTVSGTCYVKVMPKTGGTVTVIASGTGIPNRCDVVTDGMNAYFIVNYRILAAPLAGGATTEVYASPIVLLDGAFEWRASLSDLVQNTTSLFFYAAGIDTPGMDLSWPKPVTPSPLPFFRGGHRKAATDTDSVQIQSTIYSPGALEHHSIAGPTMYPSLLWPGSDIIGHVAVSNPVIDGQDIFFVGTRGIERMPFCGARSPEVIVPSISGTLAVDSGHVYWSPGAGIYRAPKGTPLSP
ncbi:MAG TPA: hypothetical protein VL242_37665 [Sorangium sp.]|nr:hypothetical protein [Sorangium sp.]